MAIKQMGPAPSNTADATTKSYVDGKAVMAIPFHLTGTQTTGVKLPEFIAPFAMTITSCYARANSGSGSAVRPSKNGGTTDGTILSSIGTTTVNNAQSVTLAAGDRLTVNVTTAGTGSDISVTFGATY